MKRIYRIIGALLLIWLCYNFGKGFVEHRHLQKDLDELAFEIRAFELRNAEIRLKIEEHQSLDYIERVAREELGLVKPGETRYIISRPSGD